MRIKVGMRKACIQSERLISVTLDEPVVPVMYRSCMKKSRRQIVQDNRPS